MHRTENQCLETKTRKFYLKLRILGKMGILPRKFDETKRSLTGLDLDDKIHQLKFLVLLCIEILADFKMSFNDDTFDNDSISSEGSSS